MNTKAVPLVLLLSLFWGSTIVVSRFSIDQLEPTTYIGLRLVLTNLGIALVYGLRIGKRKWPRNAQLWRNAIVMGILGTAVPMTGMVSSLQYLSSGLASILITVNPAITVVLAHFFLEDETLTRRKGFGVVLALSGTVLLAALGETGLPEVESGNLTGYLWVFGAMVSGSIATIFARKYMRTQDAFDVTGIRLFIAACVVIPLSIIFVGFDISQVNPQGWLALVYAALVGTFLGMLLSFYNIQRFGAIAAVMTSYVTPIFASLMGVLFLGEHITIPMLAGVVLIILGVWMINRS